MGSTRNPGPDTPCWHCQFYGGMSRMGDAARCHGGKGLPWRTMPQYGCCDFRREVGADDVPEWVPPGADIPKRISGR